MMELAIRGVHLYSGPVQDVGDAVRADAVVAVVLLALDRDSKHERLEPSDQAWSWSQRFIGL